MNYVFFHLFKYSITLLLIKCCKSDRTSGFCDSSFETWASCKNLTAIPYETLPNSIVFLELTSSNLGLALRPNEVTKFQSFKYLRSLYLTSNKFEVIEDNTFLSLNLLSSLDISGNSIRVFRENTFVGLRSLIYLYASDNSLNFIAPYAFAALPSVQFLDLERNNLSYIAHEFVFLKDLSTLLLANNQIVEIKSEAFAELPNLWHLSLFGNQLNLPNPHWFYGIIRNDGIVELDYRSNLLERNPWVCCSNISEYREYVKSLSSFLQRSPQLDIKCYLPSNLFSRNVNTLSNKDINSSCSNLTTTTKSWSHFLGTHQLGIFENDVTTHRVVSTTVIYENILSNLSNTEVCLLFAFFAIFGGAFATSVCFILQRNKRKISKTEESEMKRTSSHKNAAQASTRLFRQNVPTYGMTDRVTRLQNNFWIHRQLVVPRDVLSSPEIDDSIIPKSLESLNSDFPAEVDKSEDEPWTAVDRTNSG